LKARHIERWLAPDRVCKDLLTRQGAFHKNHLTVAVRDTAALEIQRFNFKYV
jgi:hypothetical protein